MKPVIFFSGLLIAGCASSPKVDTNPPMRPGGPNWEQIDKSVERTREREKNKGRLVEVERTQEQGFRQMSDEEYSAAYESARAEVKKANPKMADAEVDQEATKRADQARRDFERSVHSSAGSTYEWRKP